MKSRSSPPPAPSVGRPPGSAFEGVGAPPFPSPTREAECRTVRALRLAVELPGDSVGVKRLLPHLTRPDQLGAVLRRAVEVLPPTDQWALAELRELLALDGVKAPRTELVRAHAAVWHGGELEHCYTELRRNRG
jgi:hypothetical protein